MAVQLPQIKRFDPVEQPSVGRIEAPIPDGSKGFEKGVQGVQNIIEVMDKVERDAADTEGLKAGSEYDKALNIKLYGDKTNRGVIHHKGNPDDVYGNLDKDADDMEASIMKRYEGASARTRRAVERALISKKNQFSDKKITAYGYQRATYEAQVKEDAVDLDVNNAGQSIAVFDGKDAATLAPFDTNIENIRQTILRHGLKNGTTLQSEEGKYEVIDEDQRVKVNMTDITAREFAEKRSKATYNAVNALLMSKQPELAKKLIKKYPDYLDSALEAKVTKQITEVEVDVKSSKAVARLENLDYKEQQAALEKMSEKTQEDREVKSRVTDRLYSLQTQRKLGEERNSDAVAEQLMTHIEDEMSKGKYVTYADFQQSEEYIAKMGEVTKKRDRDTIRDMFEKRKKSEPDALAEAYDKVTDGGYYGMTGAEFRALESRLSEEHGKWARAQWQKANTETEAQENSKATRIQNMIYESYKAGGLIEYNKGSETPESMTKRAQFGINIRKQLDSFPKDMTQAEIVKYVDDRIRQDVFEAQEAKRSWFMRTLYPGVKPKSNVEGFVPDRVKGQSKGETKRVEAPQSKPFKDWSNEEKAALSDAFFAANKRRAKDLKELLDWQSKAK